MTMANERKTSAWNKAKTPIAPARKRSSNLLKKLQSNLSYEWKYNRTIWIAISATFCLVLVILATLVYFLGDPNAAKQNKEYKQTISVINTKLNALSSNDEYWNKFIKSSDFNSSAYLTQFVPNAKLSGDGFFLFLSSNPPERLLDHRYAYNIIHTKSFDDLYICNHYAVHGLFNDQSTCSVWRRVNHKLKMRTATADTPQKALNKIGWNTDLNGVFMPLGD